jgi:glyoxylase-like metal-dependent hydrolase (beta-lactamase superfamily II)
MSFHFSWRAGVLALCAIAGTSFAAEPIWDGNRIRMTAESLDAGVVAFYAADARELNARGGAAATSSGLIVGRRGALLVDTMLNQRLNAQVLALARDATPLPLLYAVNTSAHGDHSYGNMYLPADTRVIQSAATRDFVEAHLDDDKAFMIANFGAGRGIEPIVARTGDLLVPRGGKLLVDLGGRTVEIIDFGFAQTGGDLFVWDAQSKVMWAGNPVIASKPSLPWLLDGHLVETLETLRKVYAFLPADARVVPGHGVALGREDLRWHIDYLAEVRRQVQAAVDEKLTLEQTIARVTMPQYGGYVLFDWVHPKLNVPAAYKDLQPR